MLKMRNDENELLITFKFKQKKKKWRKKILKKNFIIDVSQFSPINQNKTTIKSYWIQIIIKNKKNL